METCLLLQEMIEEEEQGGGGANHLGADLHLTKLQPASQQRNPRRKTRWFSTKMVFTHFEGNKPSCGTVPLDLVLMWHSPT